MLFRSATLSDRYITDRFLPDKAIDLVDEACATLKVEMESMPQELDELERKILQLQIEKTSLQKETEKKSANTNLYAAPKTSFCKPIPNRSRYSLLPGTL